MSGLLHAPAAITKGKTGYPLYRRLGDPQNPSGQVLTISSPPRLVSQTDQSVVTVLCQLQLLTVLGNNIQDTATAFKHGKPADVILCISSLQKSTLLWGAVW
jgi:hypothetical protein